jgi:flagellar biosynthesis protein FlhB
MFKYILGFSAFVLAGCAAFFSIKGIALLFAASFWSVAIMAGSMELAKLVSASYLYRSWDKINKILKKYMLSAVILLMLITSLGIFGFLSDAFQRNFSEYSINLNKINSFKNQQSFYISQIDFNKSKLKDLIELQKTYQSSLDSTVKQEVITTKTTGGGFFSSEKTEKVTDQKLLDSKNKTIAGSQQNINALFSQISTATTDLQNLEKNASEISQEIIKLESDNTKGEIGTFKFVAEAFNLKIETAVRIFILLIVIVFDPLAVCLVIAYNSFSKNKDAILVQNQIKKEEVLQSPMGGLKVIYRDFVKDFKRGTKAPHNPDLADPKIV